MASTAACFAIIAFDMASARLPAWKAACASVQFWVMVPSAVLAALTVAASMPAGSFFALPSLTTASLSATSAWGNPFIFSHCACISAALVARPSVIVLTRAGTALAESIAALNSPFSMLALAPSIVAWISCASSGTTIIAWSLAASNAVWAAEIEAWPAPWLGPQPAATTATNSSIVTGKRFMSSASVEWGWGCLSPERETARQGDPRRLHAHEMKARRPGPEGCRSPAGRLLALGHHRHLAAAHVEHHDPHHGAAGQGPRDPHRPAEHRVGRYGREAEARDLSVPDRGRAIVVEDGAHALPVGDRGVHGAREAHREGLVRLRGDVAVHEHRDGRAQRAGRDGRRAARGGVIGVGEGGRAVGGPVAHLDVLPAHRRAAGGQPEPPGSPLPLRPAPA